MLENSLPLSGNTFAGANVAKTVRSFGSYQSAVPTMIAYILYMKVTKVTSQASIQHRKPLMLENSLPLSGNTLAGANVLLQEVNPCLHSVPLHHINLKSDFALGTGCRWY
jgi:hypothetical protein